MLFYDIKNIPLIYKIQKFIKEYSLKNLNTNENDFLDYICEIKNKTDLNYTFKKLVKMINIYKYTNITDYIYMKYKLNLAMDIKHNLLIKIKKWKYDKTFDFGFWHDILMDIRDIKI